MTFWTDEQSLASGVPYELHEFQLGDSATYWRYADAPGNVSYGGNTFLKANIFGGDIERGTTAIKSQTIVKCDWALAFAWQYTVAPPENIIHYTRYKGHGSNVVTVFMGDVVNVIFRQSSRKGKRWAEIMIDPATAAMNRMGLRNRYSRTCVVHLYEDGCGVDPDSFKQSGTLSAVSGNTLTSATFGGESDGYWVGGKITVANVTRKILTHSGNDITIWPAISGLVGTESFDIWPGCDHLYATCRDTFSNNANYRGQPNIPDDNPFSPWGF